jgi:hypothetical protein
VSKSFPRLSPWELQRFWAKVQKPSLPEFMAPAGGFCWVWTGEKSDKGYGLFNARTGRYRAHRLSLYLAIGDYGDLLVLHSCHRPACVNPNHLRPGTVRDNLDDWFAKMKKLRELPPALLYFRRAEFTAYERRVLGIPRKWKRKQTGSGAEKLLY